MERIIGLFVVAAAGLTALVAFRRTRKEKDVVVENLRYRGAY